jgi:predicted O-methyltransferase YrrM
MSTSLSPLPHAPSDEPTQHAPRPGVSPSKMSALRAQIAAHRDAISAAGEVLSASGKPVKLWPVGMDRPAADALRDLVIRQSAGRTLEIGLGLGLASLAMVEGLLTVGKPDAEHVTIDPTPQWCDMAGVLTLERSGAMEVTRLIQEPSHLALPRLLIESGASFDVALIDGAHWFDSVIMDIFFAMRVVKPRGLIILDDHWMPSIQTALAHAVQNHSVALELFDPSGPARRLVAFANPFNGETREWDHFEPFGRDDLPAYPWRRDQTRGAKVST